MGKINLCRTNIGNYKERAWELRRKELHETGVDPERSPKQFL
jgi:hypothetical protein